jgi:hypothetical protein
LANWRCILPRPLPASRKILFGERISEQLAQLGLLDE